MAAAYDAADLVVARAGAMTVAEVAAAGRPALLVPFAAATHGHQEANGRDLESLGAAVVVTEAEATEESLAAALASLLGDPLRLLAMGEAARRSSAPDAASRLCDLLFEVEAA
jgi:UDP-N-acetylglucosamine--N-acetylmuramyl-(pentapeptide) pyrophosphoryl-undecaprenol N-acetylglucosamine transferase